MMTAADALECVRNLQVFDRFATFPDEPQRLGEYQVFVRWWNDFRGSSRSDEHSVLGSGETQLDAAQDALRKVDAALATDERRLAALRKRIRETLARKDGE